MIKKIRQHIEVKLVGIADRFLRRRGFVPIERYSLLAARGYLYNIVDRSRKLSGGNASRYTVGERNKKVRRLAMQLDVYLDKMDRERYEGVSNG